MPAVFDGDSTVYWGISFQNGEGIQNSECRIQNYQIHSGVYTGMLEKKFNYGVLASQEFSDRKHVSSHESG